MSVPDTNTFTLQDVATELGLGATTDLVACFAAANSGGFDALYQPNSDGSFNNLLNFRNYTHIVTEIGQLSIRAREWLLVTYSVKKSSDDSVLWSGSVNGEGGVSRVSFMNNFDMQGVDIWVDLQIEMTGDAPVNERIADIRVTTDISVSHASYSRGTTLNTSSTTKPTVLTPFTSSSQINADAANSRTKQYYGYRVQSNLGDESAAIDNVELDAQSAVF